MKVGDLVKYTLKLPDALTGRNQIEVGTGLICDRLISSDRYIILNHDGDIIDINKKYLYLEVINESW
jgi:hypothetical protein